MSSIPPIHRVLGCCFALALAAAAPLQGQTSTPISEGHLRAFQPRIIGPAVTGGRVHDVEALPTDPSTIFVASASGGLWKTINRGITWENVFDTMAVSTFGDVAIAPSDHDIVYAGTGEQNNRQSTWAFRRPGTSGKWRSTPTIPTWHMWQPSGTSGHQAPSGACSRQPTGESPGRGCSM